MLLWKTCVPHFQVCDGLLSFQRPCSLTTHWVYLQSHRTSGSSRLHLHFLCGGRVFSLLLLSVQRISKTAAFFLSKSWSERLILFVHYFKSVLLNWYQREWRAAAVWAGGGMATKSWSWMRGSQSFCLIENRNKSAFLLASVKPYLDLEYVVCVVHTLDMDPQSVSGQKTC